VFEHIRDIGRKAAQHDLAYGLGKKHLRDRALYTGVAFLLNNRGNSLVYLLSDST